MNAQSQANLSSWFDKTTTKVKQDADWIERQYLLPWKDHAGQFFAEHPATFTFLATFAALSSLPIAAFLGFAVLTTSIVSFSALTFAFCTSAFVIIAAAFFLFGLLFVQLLIAGSLTFTALTVYVAYRLFFHLRDPSGGGVRGWSTETRASISTPWSQQQQQSGPREAGVEPNGAEAASAHS